MLCKHYRRTGRLLITACILIVFLTSPGARSLAGEPRSPAKNFVELDSELQAIKAEILVINQEIMSLEELALYPLEDQWVVLVSVESGSLVMPDSITLRLNGKTVADYVYSPSEGAALQAGGVHRLYSGAVSSGDYRFDISWSGKRARNQKHLEQQRSITITKSPGPKYVELQLGTGEGDSNAGVTIREWQQ